MQPDRATLSAADLGAAAAKPRLDVKALLLRYALVLVLFVFVAVLGASNASFFTLSNFNVVLLQVSTNALLATGATYVILTGGIDLSVGSVVGLSGVVAAMVAQRDGAGFTVAAVAATPRNRRRVARRPVGSRELILVLPHAQPFGGRLGGDSKPG